MKVTLRDVARKTGLSVTTVSRALNGFDDVAEETRQMIRDTAVAMGYTPNLTARRLKTQRTDTIGFIIPTFAPRFSDPFFSDFLAGVGNEAAAHHYDLLISTHAPQSEEEKNAYRRAVNGGWVDGLIIIRTRKNDERIRFLTERSFPFVSFGRTTADFDYPFIDEDSYSGMYKMVQHLVELGHTQIGFITPPKGLMFANYRLLGFYQAMAFNSLSVKENWIIEGDLTQRGGAAAMAQLFDRAPSLTAVIGGNDLMAIGAMNEARQRNLAIGRDISISGFDDVPTAAFTTPPLTTMRQPIYEIGQQTCAMLIDQLSGRVPESTNVLLTPTLVIRESTGPAPARRD